MKQKQSGQFEGSDHPSETEDIEVFEDVIPTGVDSDGNKVCLEDFVLLRFPDDDGKRTTAIEKIRDGHDRAALNAYFAWYVLKTGSPLKTSGDFEESRSMREHVAGPHCEHHRGYNWHAISADEMKYCTTVQFLAPYDGERHDTSRDSRIPEPDDEDFERDGVYHLSGLADRCANIEDDDCEVYPVRHGMYEVYPMPFDGFDEGEPPFHPHCLEIYRRVAIFHRRTNGLSSLAGWIDRKDTNSPYHRSEPPAHPAVHRGADQWWFHRSGDEFLAAYPLHVPALSLLLDSAKRPQHDFDARSSQFDRASSESTQPKDLFERLPQEIRDMILPQLGSRDIADLRLASRSFRHLPFTLWHDLMQKEMPWIWEAWSDRPYPLMACTTKQELMRHDQEIQVRKAAAADLPRSERLLNDEIIAHDDAEFRRPRPVEQLDRLHTDWYYLYCQLRKEWKNIKGLQNRERIWKAAEFVVRRVQDPDEDYGIAEQEHAKAFPYQDLNGQSA